MNKIKVLHIPVTDEFLQELKEKKLLKEVNEICVAALERALAEV